VAPEQILTVYKCARRSVVTYELLESRLDTVFEASPVAVAPVQDFALVQYDRIALAILQDVRDELI
jgi:hypothetical protein